MELDHTEAIKPGVMAGPGVAFVSGAALRAAPGTSYNFARRPDWIRSTRVFQASFLSTARLLTSPILTSPASLTTDFRAGGAPWA
jgi:hypothetical protein